MRLHAAALCFALSLLAVSNQASAEVFRCTNSTGKTEYRDKPCDAGESKSVTIPSPPARDAPRDANLQHEANMGRVAVGMSPLQVRQAWGAPKVINTDVRASGTQEQWVYARGGSDQYVYINNGKVSSISTRTTSESAPAASGYQPPPSRQDLDAAERAEKAGERRLISTSMRFHRDEIRMKLGEPDSKTFNNGLEFWVYLPTGKDPQTRTLITFDGGGFKTDIDRRVAR